MQQMMNKIKKAPKFTFAPVPERVAKKVLQQRVNVDRLYKGRWTVQPEEPAVPKIMKKTKKKRVVKKEHAPSELSR